MIRQQERVLNSMARIREVIITQQAALAEQRSHEYNHKPGSEMDDDGSMYQDKLDGSGGFAGSDTKKRRGVCFVFSFSIFHTHTFKQRAAPPGRCHSCNRAETPEWRRGPDGARTLCNACGLRTYSSRIYHNSNHLHEVRFREINPQNGIESLFHQLQPPAQGNGPYLASLSHSFLSVLPLNHQRLRHCT